MVHVTWTLQVVGFCFLPLDLPRMVLRVVLWRKGVSFQWVSERSSDMRSERPRCQKSSSSMHVQLHCARWEGVDQDCRLAFICMTIAKRATRQRDGMRWND